MKVGIIGAGAVGSACLLALAMRGCASEIVVVNRNPARALGLVTDVQYGAPLSSNTAIRAGDYSDLKGAALVLITAGLNEKAGGATDRSDPAGRLKLLDANVEVYKAIIPQLQAVDPNVLVLVVTDPPDPLADAVRLIGHDRVLSTGTYLDTLRFRFHIAQRFHVSPMSVEAYVLGEHGTSEVFVWSSARIGGTPLEALIVRRPEGSFDDLRREVEQQVRYANISIIEGIGASQYGIGMVSARIAGMILRDERTVAPLGAFDRRYGVTLSLPSVVGRDGALSTIDPALSLEEQQALLRSAETLRRAIGRLRL